MSRPSILRQTPAKPVRSRAARMGPSVAAENSFRLGYVPLIDAAPLLVAAALGYFERAGVRVELSRELGWGSIRERIVYGELDGAHTPGGLLYSILLGTHAPECAVSTDLVLNLQGNAITLSRRLWERGVRDARGFRAAVRGPGARRLVMAVVSPFASHHFLLREWLRSAGLDPDRDVQIRVLPPPLVVGAMRDGQIEGFCAGEPWNSAAALGGEGWIVATSGDLAPGHPEKVLTIRDNVRKCQPEAYAALRSALVAACRYCDEPKNRAEVAGILAQSGIFQLPPETLRNSLEGPFHDGVEPRSLPKPFITFYRGDANRASRERAAWCLSGLVESRLLVPTASSRQRCFDAFLDEPPSFSARKLSTLTA